MPRPMRKPPPTPTSWAEELRQGLRLAAPIVAVQLGQMGLGLVDVLMVGRSSDAALAGIALGNMVVWMLLGFGSGVVAALDPVLSQAYGAGRTDAIRAGTQRGLALAVALGIAVSLLALGTGPILTLLDQPEEVRPLAADYVRWSIPGMVPLLVFAALRQSLQALSTIRPVLWTMLVANVLNAALNEVFIFGRLGMPALGLRGSALASDVSRLWMAIGLAWAGWPLLRDRLRPFDRAHLHPRAWLDLLRIGTPIGAQFLMEMGAFSAAMVFIGHIGAEQVAGHKVALTLASTSFMVPVGIGAAAAVRVGYAVGRRDEAGFRRAACVGIGMGAGTMAVFGGLFLMFPHELARLFTDSAAIVPIAATLIPFAGVFQVFDGIQAVGIGVLRGLADTRFALIVNVLGYWVLAVPLGYWLAFPQGLGAAGLWWGLTLGLALVAVVVGLRVLWHFRRPLRPLDEASAPPPAD
ncbi:MAG: putative multidrug resistance protein MdtK [Planctomycetota bacterium]